MDRDHAAWLTGLLENGPTWVRKYCARELGKRGDARAVAPLCAALKDDAIGEVVIQALAQLGEPAVAPLCKALKDEDPRVRCRAAEALGRIMDRQAVRPLCEALKDEEWSVRAQAIKALGGIRDPHAAPALIELLEYEQWSVRVQVIEALSNISAPDAAPALIALLEHPDRDTRMQVARALAEIGRPAVQSLCAALKNENVQVRGQAAAILGRIRDAGAILPLCDALRRGQIEAGAALREIATRAAVPELQAALPLLCERAGYVYNGYEERETVRIALMAIGRIEVAAATMAKLPIPATAPPPSAEGLPVPAGPPAPSVGGLPLPAAAADKSPEKLEGQVACQSTSRAAWQSWWQRLGRLIQVRHQPRSP